MVLAAYLMAAPEFAVIDAAPLPPVEPIGLFDALPVEVRDDACAWERHVVEVESGLPPGAAVGTIPRRGYDPASTTLLQRDQTKATELGVSVRTVQARRARYAQQGLWGLVDQRAARVSAATGRADPRVVDPIVGDVANHFRQRWQEAAGQVLPVPVVPAPAGDVMRTRRTRATSPH